MKYIVWEHQHGSKYEQPICFDLTKEMAEMIASPSMCPAGYTRSVEPSPPEIDLWLEFQSGK